MSLTAKQSPSRQFKAKLPADVLSFLAEEAERFGSSINSELTRAAREKMERAAQSRLEEGAAR